MPHFNHRSGLPSRVRNDHHTRWATDEQEISLPVAIFIAAAVLLMIIWLFVPTN